MIRHGPYLRPWLDLAYANSSTEPYFVYKHPTIDTEGHYQLFAYTTWASCDESGVQVSFIGDTTNYTNNFSIDFTIKKGGQDVDLVAATANDTCSGQVGFTLNVTDKTYEVAASGQIPAGTCAVLASPYPTPAVGRCRVKIDTAADASISADLHARLCKGFNPPNDCPEEGNAVQQLAVAGVASFAAVFGAIGFLLA